MTPERAREIADQAWRKFSASFAWNTQDVTLHIVDAVLLAVSEERARCIDICEKDLTQTAQKIANVIRGNALEDAK